MDGRFLRAVLWFLAAYSSVTQGATLLPTDASAFVTAHNILRCMHNVPPITWSSALATTAQAWAAVCNGQPTDNATRQQLNIGENIVGTTVAFPSPQVILDAWYAQESPLVDWASPTLQPATQHVTQVLWKASIQIGCAQCAQGGDSEFLWTVCQYSLAGNVPSGVAGNVLPPIHSRQECTVSPASPSPASTVVSALPQRPRAASDSPSPRSRPAAPATTTLSASVVALVPSQLTAFVSAHNVLRCMHGAPPLTWSSVLAATAQAWASVCNGQPTNASTLQQLNAGENILGSTLDFPSPQAMLDAWYSQESPLVDWASPTLQPATQHLTQILWKASTQIGCAQCSEGGDSDKKWTVCQYSVAGNEPGSVAANVLPPLHSRQECTESPASSSASPAALPERQHKPSDSPSPELATPSSIASQSASPSPSGAPSASPRPSLSPAGAATPSTSGSKCADEGGVCSCTGLVQFGVGASWSAPRDTSGQVACSNGVFGDPKPGHVKACYCLPVPASASPSPTANPTAALQTAVFTADSPSPLPSLSAGATGYAKCADEGGVCGCSGLVQFGVGTAWTTPRAVSGQVACSNNQFGDPKPGKVKACYCLATTIIANAAVVAVDPAAASQPAESSSTSSSGFFWPWLALPFALLAIAAVLGALLYCHCHRRAQQRAETFLDPEGLRWDAAAQSRPAPDTGSASPGPAPTLLPEASLFSPTGRASPTVPPPTPGSPVVSQCVV